MKVWRIGAGVRFWHIWNWQRKDRLVNKLHGAVVRDMRGAKYGIVQEGYWDPHEERYILYFGNDPRSVGPGE